jgi:serine/threonine-protein kinase
MAGPSTIVFGRYRLVAELGQGGMAQVFLALSQGPVGFNKLVVLKLIREQFAEDPEFLTMFLDEARLAARLNHPNVVQTNEVGQEAGRYFICMEYLEGQPYNRVLSRVGAARTDRPEHERLTLGMQLRILVDALAGLHSAHELTDFDGTPLSVVHRDVSPHNLFVTYAGGVKVVDFGIAKALSSSSETRTGVLKGKIGYMAPEQARGEHVDRRADLFSVGMILWETIVGKRMWKGLPDVAILQRVITGDIPSPRTEAPWVSPRLEAVTMRALAFDKNHRYATALEFASAIESVLDEVDRGSSRDAGRVVERAFDAERVRIKAIVESQIAGVKMTPDGMFDPHMTGTMPRLPMLDHARDMGSGGTGRGSFGSGPHTGAGVSTGTGARASFGGTPPPGSLPSAPGASDPRLVSSSLTANLTPAELAARGPSAPTSGKTLALGAALALVVGGAFAAAFFAGRGSHDPAPASSASAAPAAPHVVRIESTPPGARVMEGAALVGTTPCALPLPEGSAVRELVVALDGYQPYTIKQGASADDVRLVVPLVAAPAASSSAAQAAGSGSPTTKKPPPPPAAKPTATPTAPPSRPLDIHMER